MRKISLKGLRKKAWKLVSEYVRRKANGKCYTCGDRKNWKEQNCGHYIHGDSLDFEVDTNLRCQCVYCNRHLHGNSGIFLSRLIKELGYDPTDWLMEKKHKVRKFTCEELELVIGTYSTLLEVLNGS